MPNDRGIEDMLFNEGTTLRIDFRYGEIKPPTFTTFKEKTHLRKQPPPDLNYVETMTSWRKPTVPFSLYHKPKEVVKTNPRDLQTVYKPPKDIRLSEEREQRASSPQRTWPDLRYAPAGARAAILFAMYRHERGDERAGVKEGPYSPANPFTLRKWQPSLVPAEWRMRSASWDRGALRTDCDHSREFWTRPRRRDVWKRPTRED